MKSEKGHKAFVKVDPGGRHRATCRLPAAWVLHFPPRSLLMHQEKKKAAENGPRPWTLAPSWETQLGFMTPGFCLAQPRLLPAFRGNAPHFVPARV